MTGPRPSRIAEAKRRAFDAKQKLAIAAAAGFVAIGWLSWASHPGTSENSASFGETSVDESGSRVEQNGDFDGFDSFGSIAPSGDAAPQVQTGVS